MSLRKWVFLPFLGSSEGRKKPQHKHEKDARKFQGENDLDGVLTKHESVADFANKKEEDIVQDYNAPTHWWVISTLFPLIAGTFGPIANAFNICAVSIDWRTIVEASSTESEGPKITDPKWLVAVNAVSLAIALISNIALLMHMTERIRFNIACPIVVGGFYIAGILDIALVAAAPKYVPLPVGNPSATYSQAYFYAIFSGAIYFLLAAMLSVTAFGVVRFHYASEFKLSLAQRSLMVQTMMFLAYVLVAGAVFSYIEGWVYLDGVYYVTVTLFTIGFGDFVCKTRLGRGLYFPMAVGGIIFVGLIIANTRTLVLESVSVKVSTRAVEKARYTAIKSGNPEAGIIKLRGLKRRDTNGATELERREKEFNAMREIQKAAAHNNRIFSLTVAVTAFMILWFIGAVCFWQAEKATGGQNWTYFESIYFTYTAQLTIGYGDFEPQTNASKPTFVFWALLALPTLTILIGAVGDAVTDSVNWALTWGGEHFTTITKWFQGLPKKTSKEDAMIKLNDRATGQDHGANVEGFHHIATIENGNMMPVGINAFGSRNSEEIDEAYRPFVIMRAAQKVLGHLDEDTPRKYSFEDWTWLLRLLGEDESTENGHRRVGLPVPKGAEVATPVRTHEGQVWSWMGQESPLMDLSAGSEPRWVLQRLMQVLEKDLKRRGDLHMGSRTSTASS